MANEKKLLEYILRKFFQIKKAANKIDDACKEYSIT
jgi:hypothetical protein